MHQLPILKLLVFTTALVSMIVFTHEVIVPFERAVLPSGVGGTLFYLPLGLWVLVAHYERWHAPFYLAPGLAIGLMLYGHPDLSPLSKALQLIVMATSAPLVFAVLSWANGRPNAPISDQFAWRFILVAGAITAIFNAIGLNLARLDQLPQTASVEAVLHFSLGGFIGLLCCLALLSVVFRLSEAPPGSW
jgi:hypothetical protein